MRRGILAAVAVLAMVALAGCGSDGDSDGRSSSIGGSADSPPPVEVPGDPVASPTVTGTPSPEVSPQRTAPPVEQILYKLHSRVLEQTRRPAPMSGSCASPITAKEAMQTTCTVVYDGIEIPFTVEITTPGVVYAFKYQQLKYPLLRAAVHDTWYQQYNTEGTRSERTEFRCDSGIPEKQAVDYTNYRSELACSYLYTPGREVVRKYVVVLNGLLTFRDN